jgi:hypothetical protein
MARWDDMNELERIRQGVVEAGRARRDAWPAPSDGPFVPGATMVLGAVDPTLQAPHDTGRAILHRAGRLDVAIPMDMVWAKRVGQLREIQTLIGFAREERWDALATVLEARPAGGAEAEGEVVVQLGPIYVHEQLVLEEDGSVPGLDVAIKALDELQAGIVVSNTTPKPELLLPLLFKILATHHWRAFRELYDQAANLSDKKVAFEQFRHAWDASNGEVTFDGYVEPQLFVDEAVEGAVVRTRLKRQGEKGEIIARPLKWVKRGAGWRLAGGIL